LYYVYHHIRLDTNEPFYVGKGKGDRFKNFERRNSYWKNIANKTSVKPEILFINLTEEEALLKESELEQQYISQGYKLVNIVPCGKKGSTGFKWTEERHEHYKQLISNANSGRILTEDHKLKLSKSNQKPRPTLNKPILQFDQQGNFIKEFENLKTAQSIIRPNNPKGDQIGLACRGKIQYAYGYIWKFK